MRFIIRVVSSLLFVFLQACEDNFSQDSYLVSDSSFQTSFQYGKSVALFGGSFTVFPGSELAKNYWCDNLCLTLTDYGVNGAGFSQLTQVESIVSSVNKACSVDKPKYDIYLFWASTNDFSKANLYVGDITDYTEEDGFDEKALKTQCGGMNYCFRKVKQKNPDALILFLTSIGAFNQLGKGTSPQYIENDGMFFFVERQKQVCEKWGIPYLDQFNKDINEMNWRAYISSDNLHLNKSGYLAIRDRQLLFLAWPYKYMN